MMPEQVFLMAMAFGAFVALIVSWPFRMWRMDRQQERTIKTLNEHFDALQQDRDSD